MRHDNNDDIEHVSIDRVSVPVLVVCGGLFTLLLGAAYSFSGDLEKHDSEIKRIELEAAKHKESTNATLKDVARKIERLVELQTEGADARAELKERVQRLEIKTGHD